MVSAYQISERCYQRLPDYQGYLNGSKATRLQRIYELRLQRMMHLFFNENNILCRLCVDGAGFAMQISIALRLGVDAVLSVKKYNWFWIYLPSLKMLLYMPEFLFILKIFVIWFEP